VYNPATDTVDAAGAVSIFREASQDTHAPTAWVRSRNKWDATATQVKNADTARTGFDRQVITATWSNG